MWYRSQSHTALYQYIAIRHITIPKIPQKLKPFQVCVGECQTDVQNSLDFFLRVVITWKNCHLSHLKDIGQIHPMCNLIDCSTLQFNQLQ